MRHPITGFSIAPSTFYKDRCNVSIVQSYRLLSKYEQANINGGNLPISNKYN